MCNCYLAKQRSKVVQVLRCLDDTPEFFTEIILTYVITNFDTIGDVVS